AQLTPALQTTANELGSFAHARQAPVSTPWFVDHGAIDSLSIVADAHLQLPVAVPDADVDSTRLGVAEGVTQRLTDDPVDVIANDRMQIARCAFDTDAHGCGPRVGAIGRELVAERPHGDRQIGGGHRGRAEVLHGVPALVDRLRGLIDGDLETFLGRTLWKEVCRRLKAEQHAV